MREPAGRRRRLFNVSVDPDSLARRLSLLLAVLAAVSIGLPASAQSGVEVSGTAGTDGWLDPDDPFSVRVNIESDILFDGVIEASMGGVDITTPAQVPAGTSKTYEVRMPPPTGQTLRVTLRDRDESQVASATISTRTPADEVLVGVGPGVEPAAFDRLTTPIVQRPLVALSIDAAETPLDLFDHLAVSLPDLSSSVIDWVRGGGTLVTDDVPDVAIESPRLADDGTELYAVGDGLVLVVDDLSDPESYVRFLIAGDLDSGRRDPWQSPDQALTEAASNSGSGGLPELPWLLAAIAGYAVVVGPVNFFVLHRMGRRDFAWVTIPVISALALGSFWVVGRERLENVSLSHATVVFAGDRPQSRSSLVLAVGSPGRYELAFDERMVVYPSVVGNNFDEFGRPVAVGGADVVGSIARFDLDQLGFAAASAIGNADVDLPLVTVGPDGESLVVDNGTDYEFWAWGVSNGSVVTAERAPLTAGSTATAAVRNVDQAGVFREPGFGMNVGDAIVQELQLWNDERGWQILSPLGRAAQFSFDEVPDLFWFGFTEDLDPAISLDGRAADPTGTTLVIVPVSQPDADSGSESGRLIDIGNGFIEPGGGPGDVFVSSDEMWLRFDLPFGASPTTISFFDQFGMRPGSFSLWDWEASELVAVGVGDAVDDRFVDSGGRIVMRVGAAGAAGLRDEGFVEIPMSPRSVSIEWSSG